MHYGCPNIHNFTLNFERRVDAGGKSVLLCCEPAVPDPPAVPLGETGEETIQSFRQMRERMLLEGMMPSEERTFTGGCLKCPSYRMDNWGSNFLIRYVNLSMYPSPCQSKCFYCDQQTSGVTLSSGTSPEPAGLGGDGVKNGYENVFGALDYAIGVGLIPPDTVWQVSCGEIAIHPYRDRIHDLVKGRTTIFFTNSFKFDERIAANLVANPRSWINVSIDSGTGETWRRVKGFDNFGEVVENLCRYRDGSGPNQIMLKYIIFPGVNDDQADFEAAVELMKTLRVGHMRLARDFRAAAAPAAEESEKLAASAGRLVALLFQNKLSFDWLWFTPAEKDATVQAATRVVTGAGR